MKSWPIDPLYLDFFLWDEQAKNQVNVKSDGLNSQVEATDQNAAPLKVVPTSIAITSFRLSPSKVARTILAKSKQKWSWLLDQEPPIYVYFLLAPMSCNQFRGCETRVRHDCCTFMLSPNRQNPEPDELGPPKAFSPCFGSMSVHICYFFQYSRKRLFLRRINGIGGKSRSIMALRLQAFRMSPGKAKGSSSADVQTTLSRRYVCQYIVTFLGPNKILNLWYLTAQKDEG